MEIKKYVPRRVLQVLGAGAGIVALSGCSEGEYTVPTTQEIQQEAQYFDLRRPDGITMPCVMYTDRGSEGYGGYSYFGLDCDWTSTDTTPPAAQTGGEIGGVQMECTPQEDGSLTCRPAN